jgi:hypothetical protein
MTLGDVMRGSTDHTTRRGASGVCNVGDGGGTTVACWSRFTKLPELRFRALLDEEGTRHIELVSA